MRRCVEFCCAEVLSSRIPPTRILVLIIPFWFLAQSVLAQNFIISPATSIVIGDRVNVKIVGLKANSKYTLKVEITDEWKRKWFSQISFYANRKGEFDLEKQRSLEGSYLGVDPLGLFWSSQLEKTPPKIAPDQFPEDNSEAIFKVLDGDSVILIHKMVRWLMIPGTKKEELRTDGLFGTLYKPVEEDTRGIAVILLGGSGGGNTWQRVTGSVLASQGYTVLALAYFNMETLPKKLELIPLEYVGKAINYIKTIPDVKAKKIGVIGYSRGSELALASASVYADLRFAVAIAPSHVVYQSFSPPDFPKTSSWTYNGNPLPFVPYKSFNPALTGRDNFTNYLKNDSLERLATIQVEKINGPVLLISGKEDLIWPSTMMADKIVKRLEAMRFRFKFRHISYDSAGHTIARFGYMPATQSTNNGGTAKGNAYAQYYAWQELIAFLKKIKS